MISKDNNILKLSSMAQQFPPPKPLPLARLSVEDGLLLNAERWQCAHAYHQSRQNLHYQSLNQPGIVCGLGVSVIPAPDEIPAQYRDGRWIKIQSGVAIDLLGNPIIIPQPMEFRVASQAKEEPIVIYIVVSYVDPEKLHRKDLQDRVQETFRIDEKISKPDDLEVELCRIVLMPGKVQLSQSDNVFLPRKNQVDLRYRQPAIARPQGIVRMAIVPQNSPADNVISAYLSGLLQSVASLYPALQGIEEVGQVKLEAGVQSKLLLEHNIIYVTYQQFITLSEVEIGILKEYDQMGGVVLVELDPKTTDLKELTQVHNKLQKTLINFQQYEIELTGIRQQFEQELEETKKSIEKQIEKVNLQVQQITRQISSCQEDSGVIFRQHPLRNQPFLFGQFPLVEDQEIKIFNWGSIILVIGPLSSAWGLGESFNLPREMIRTAQEIGINILHFAWRRRQLMQLQL